MPSFFRSFFFVLFFLLPFSLVHANIGVNETRSVFALRVYNKNDGTEISGGSGVLINNNGSLGIVTNDHVVTKAARDPDNYGVKMCITLENTAAPECVFYGEVVEYSDQDEGFDLALVQLTYILDDQAYRAEGIFDNPNYFPSIKWKSNFLANDGEHVNIGDKLSVLGYPISGGDTITLTTGVVSGFDRLPLESGESIPYIIKTDAEIGHGNSGGAAFDENNNFVGIPTWKYIDNNDYLGFIISTSLIIKFLNDDTFPKKKVFARDFFPTQSWIEKNNICQSGYVSLEGLCLPEKESCDGKNQYPNFIAQRCMCRENYFYNQKTDSCELPIFPTEKEPSGGPRTRMHCAT